MEGKMKALMKTEAKPGAELREVPIPKLAPREVLVKVKACSICGTDQHIYGWDKWAQSRVKAPMIFGHEFAGEVVERGSLVSKVEIGDHVSGETHIADYNCFQCRIANAHICENLKILGVDTNGSYAEYIAIPENNAIHNDKSIPHEVATAQEPLGNAVHTVFAQDISGRRVSIFGCGPIGLCSIMLCKAAGATEIYAVDANEYRLNMARKLGATLTINASSEDPAKRILKETGKGVDVFLEMSGHEPALKAGFESLRGGGDVAILGVFPKEVTMDINNYIVFKSATVRGINGRKLFSTWYKVAAFQKSGAVDLRKIITHKFKLEEYGKAFELLKSGNCGKIVMIP
ncbi:MAG TPA: L-threonine 3-dehydrogenase [Candidatus Norongarragalinales archaeon]|nr:L-threonine 3-dehydrogenase [Candidatus Norongarragalinales archaeon]